MKFYKITNEKENHNGVQIHDGRVDDPTPFDEDDSTGGIRFAPVTSILSFVGFGPWIREVTIPADVSIVNVSGFGPRQYKAASVVFGPRMRWMRAEVLHQLIDEGADISDLYVYMLHLAAREGNLAVIKFLVSRDVDIHMKNDMAACLAAQNGHLDVVQYLIGLGVQIADGFVLSWAIKGEQFDVARFLLATGADINANDGQMLRHAIENGNLAVVKFLLENGASTEMDHGIKSPISVAIHNGHTHIIEYLLDTGVGGSMDWAMATAASYGNLDTLKCLIEHNGMPKDSRSVFGWAAMHDNTSIMEYLITQGVEKSVVADVLENAIHNGHFDTVQYLMETHPEIQIDIVQGIRTAAENGNFDTAEYLESKLVEPTTRV